MIVTPVKLYWCDRVQESDSSIDRLPLRRGPHGDVSGNQEEIDILTSDLLLEPRLLHGVAHLRDDRLIGIACKVENESETLYSQSMLRGKISVPVGQRHEFSSVVIVYFDVAGKVLASPSGCEVVVRVECHTRNVKFMIARSQQVIW